MLRNCCNRAKQILLLCLICFLLSSNLALAATVKLFSNYDSTFADPNVLTVAYGDTNSLVREDNYKSHSNGVIQAYSMTVKYFAVQDVPGFGRFTNELYDGKVYFYASNDGKLHAESYSDHERDVLASTEFTDNLQIMLKSYHSNVYSDLLQAAAIQKEKEKQLAQQQIANELAAIQANPAGRHPLADNLWKDVQPKRVQLLHPELAAYWEDNAIHYGSYIVWFEDYTAAEDQAGVKRDYAYMYLKRNTLTDYGQYIIVNKDNKIHTCFDYDEANDTFIIYDNETKAPDYSLHFYTNNNGREQVDAKNISGNPVKLWRVHTTEDHSWTQFSYDDNTAGELSYTGFVEYLNDKVVLLPNSRTDGYRLFLQYGKLLK